MVEAFDYTETNLQAFRDSGKIDTLFILCVRAEEGRS